MSSLQSWTSVRYGALSPQIAQTTTRMKIRKYFPHPRTGDEAPAILLCDARSRSLMIDATCVRLTSLPQRRAKISAVWLNVISLKTYSFRKQFPQNIPRTMFMQRHVRTLIVNFYYSIEMGLKIFYKSFTVL